MPDAMQLPKVAFMFWLGRTQHRPQNSLLNFSKNNAVHQSSERPVMPRLTQLRC